MRVSRKSIIVLAAMLVAFGAPARQPNIIVLLADDLGYGELGCQGNPEIPTPNIDALAAAGVRFTQGYAAGPNCSPSRAGLLTGRIPTRFGYEFNPIGDRNEEPGVGLPADQPIIAKHLHDAGYTTALLGKWHQGGTAPYHPQRRGFDEFFGFMHEGHYFVPPPWEGVTTMLRRRALPEGGEGRWYGDRLVYSTHMKHDEPAYDADNPILRAGQPVVESAYFTDALTREALAFIDRNKDKPFYLHLAYNAVHSPLQGADAYIERFAHIEDIHRRIFAAMLANLDDSVGAVLRKIEETGLEQDTLVFFLSDNGGPTRELTSSNLPLRGEKSSLYDGGVRVPFMVRWPGVLPAGVLYEKPVSSLDILPTALAAAGSEIPKNADGVDLAPYLQGKMEGAPNPVLYWRQGNKTALRQGEWKIVRMGGRAENPAAWELYHIEEDISETTDLATEYPERIQEMEKVWAEYESVMHPPLF